MNMLAVSLCTNHACNESQNSKHTQASWRGLLPAADALLTKFQPEGWQQPCIGQAAESSSSYHAMRC
jgi:hypothetical protein